MPDVTPTQSAARPEAPAPIVAARPPFTGRENGEALAVFIIGKLTEEAGVGLDGAPRWRAERTAGGCPFILRYVESALVARVEKCDSGITPYKIVLSAQAQTVSGATGAEPRDLVVKLHANGEASFAKLVMAALVHAQRTREAAERRRIAAERENANKAALVAYLRDEFAAGAFPLPDGFADLDAAIARYDRAGWHWNLTMREGDSDIGLKLYVQIVMRATGDRADFTPAGLAVNLSVGFGPYANGTRVVKLSEAFLVLRGVALGAAHVRDTLTPRENAPAAVAS